MRLTDFSPKWFGLPGAASNAEAQSIKIGFIFYCPCNACEGRRGQSRIMVHIDPPIDPHNLLPETTWITPQPAWQRSGDTFENITLTPSVDQSQHGHWHGNIINGELISA